MQISPRLLSSPTPALPRSSTPPSAPPAESRTRKVVREVEEEVADVVLLFAKVPFLRDLGYKLYGLFTRPKADLPTIGNTGTLVPGLTRGAQPTEKGFEALKAQGVNTVINLRPEAQWEAPLVKQQGMNYVYLPLPAVGAPSPEQALQFLSLVTDPKNGNVFFHCQHGADRTGAMAAAYRIAAQGWTADQAIAEMYQYKFHTGFEDAKLDFVRQFAAYWQGLDAQTKASVLHRSLDLTA